MKTISQERWTTTFSPSDNRVQIWDQDGVQPENLSFEACEQRAKLVAAAPELLEALKLCFARLDEKADTCKNKNWKGADQIAFEAADKVLTRLAK